MSPLTAPTLPPLPLAHAGSGAAWQALLTLVSLGVAVVAVLVVARVIRLETPGDLILPLAVVAVLASLTGTVSDVLSDWVGWAFPIGVVALAAIVLWATTSLSSAPTSPVTISLVVLAAVAATLLQGPIVRAWHPIDIGPPSAQHDDLQVEITELADGATVAVGDIPVTVAVTGGTLGSGFRPDQPPPDDPEQRVGITLTAVSDATGESTAIAGTPAADCTDGCETATFEIPLDTPGDWTIFVEAKTTDARSFTGPSATDAVTARVTVTAEP